MKVQRIAMAEGGAHLAGVVAGLDLAPDQLVVLPGGHGLREDRRVAGEAADPIGHHLLDPVRRGTLDTENREEQERLEQARGQARKLAGGHEFHRELIYLILAYQLINRCVLLVVSHLRGEKRRKAELAGAWGAGVMVWEIDQDTPDHRLIRSLREALQKGRARARKAAR